MKRLLVATLALSFAIPAFSRSSNHTSSHNADNSLSSVGPAGTGTNSKITHVKEYTKRNGTRVKSYDRTSKDDTKADNWSAKGNINPETGRIGTR